MKNLFYTLFTAVLLFTTACQDDAPTPATNYLNKSIRNILSTSQSTYDDASDGDWITVTEAEYNALATALSSVTRSGMPEDRKR